MSTAIDYSIATSEQIEASLCSQVENIRLALNLTRAQLAGKAGVGMATIQRMEKGQGVTLDTFIRVLMALGLQENLQTLLPDPTIRPIERVDTHGRERRRARPSRTENDNSTWNWGDETGEPK